MKGYFVAREFDYTVGYCVGGNLLEQRRGLIELDVEAICSRTLSLGKLEVRPFLQNCDLEQCKKEEG